MRSRVKLGSLLKIQHGYAFKSENYVPISQYRLVTLGNFNEGSNSFKYNDAKATYYGADFPDEFILKNGDLIMPLTEQVVGLFGNTAFVPAEDRFQFVLNQRVGKVICDETKIDKTYLHFVLATKSVKDQLEARANGTKQRNISPTDVYDVVIELPDMTTQIAIGSFLHNIELKIENNAHICSELESMARTIYDYWFTQFDFPNAEGKPYRSSGGKMVWNEQLKRDIPEGWEVGNLYDIADFVNGLACQKYRPKESEDSLPVIKIKEMHDGITADTERVSIHIPEKNIVSDGDILFSWSATLEVMYWFGGTGGLNQHIFKVFPINGFSKEYVYHQLSGYVINFVKMAEARKTTMGHITTDHLEQSRIVLPPKSFVESFTETIAPIHQKLGQCQKENRELAALRDWLLPMLMNGQATIE